MECGPLLAVQVRNPFVAIRREAKRHDGEPLVPEVEEMLGRRSGCSLVDTHEGHSLLTWLIHNHGR
jgi:hypothetical protein